MLLISKTRNTKNYKAQNTHKLLKPNVLISVLMSLVISVGIVGSGFLGGQAAAAGGWFSVINNSREELVVCRDIVGLSNGTVRIDLHWAVGNKYTSGSEAYFIDTDYSSTRKFAYDVKPNSIGVGAPLKGLPSGIHTYDLYRYKPHYVIGGAGLVPHFKILYWVYEGSFQLSRDFIITCS